MRVVIAGSRQLPRGQAPRLLVRFLANLPADALILLRKGVHTRPGTFEQDVATLCDILALDYQWCLPYPTDTVPGRASVFLRDIDMISACDLALLFLAETASVVADGGTRHLLDKAIDQNRPVYAYTVAEDGVVERHGEHDPDHLYAEIVPAA